MTSPVSHDIQADPAFVSDCLGEHATRQDCVEESDEQQPDRAELKQDQTKIASSDMNNGSLFLSFLKTIIALAFILVLIYLSLKFLKKRNKLYQQVRALESLGGISVGQNKSIQIVRVGTKVYLIGVGENVELLEEIDDHDVIAELLKKQEPNDFKTGDFLKNLFNKETNNHDESSGGSHPHFKQLFSNELTRLKKNRQNLKKQQKEKE